MIAPIQDIHHQDAALSVELAAPGEDASHQPGERIVNACVCALSGALAVLTVGFLGCAAGLL